MIQVSNRLAGSLAFFGVMFFLAINVQADALWYTLESGSKVELVNGASTELTGRVALLGCGGNEQADTNASKRPYPFHAIKFDNTPDALESQIHGPKDGNIPLFGGPGVGVAGRASMIARSDGKVTNFDWFLQHKLEQDYGNEALIYTRRLMLDSKEDSRISFRDQQQACPDTIKLSLVIKDTHATYTPEVKVSPSGEQEVTARPKGDWKEETIGTVTIIATAIPGSEEKVRSKYVERPLYVEKPEKPPVTSQVEAPDATVSQPIPVKARPVRPKMMLRVQPKSQGE